MAGKIELMGKLARWNPLILGLALACASSACSRQQGILPPNQPATSQLPFAASSNDQGVSPTVALASAEIPAGTSLALRLEQPLSSANCHPGDAFKAALADPVVLQDQTLAPVGAPVSGTVIAAKASGQDGAGFLRLTLASLTLNGKNFPVHTSSVFSNGESNRRGQRTKVGGNAKFSTDQRLIFHLIDPVSVTR